MFSIFGVSVVLYFIKILSGSRNFWHNQVNLRTRVIFAYFIDLKKHLEKITLNF